MQVHKLLNLLIFRKIKIFSPSRRNLTSNAALQRWQQMLKKQQFKLTII
jgi:hypothetical protein